MGDNFIYEDDYGLEYSEESTSEPDVDLENQYYLAKALKEDHPENSVAAFQKVLDIQGEPKGEWGFKALKQLVKINFQLRNYEETMKRYKELLSYINSAVTKNHGEKAINSILDYTSSSKNMSMLQDFYETTLEALKNAKNDRLWFKTNTKLGKVYLERREFSKLAQIVKQLKQHCKCDEDSGDPHKGTQLLEIYALEIQMYTEQKNHKQLKDLYERSLKVRSAIPHPLLISVIRECGGKMHLRAGDYEKAYCDFFEAFKNYDEAGGGPRRTACLRYLLLNSMLMKSAIDPFDSQEAKPYKSEPEIKTMRNMIQAYQSNQMTLFVNLYNQHKESLMADPFIKEHLGQLLKNVRTSALLNLVRAYKIIKLSYLSQELGVEYDELESLLVSCIMDGQIKGKIDQINQALIKTCDDDKRYEALDKWTESLKKISFDFAL